MIAVPRTFVATRIASRMGSAMQAGSVRVVVLLAAIWIAFGIAEPRFLSAGNLVNLGAQIVPVGIISIGVVLVLLLGEIDLSAGAVSGMCASIAVVMIAFQGVPVILAILVALAVGGLVGGAQGLAVVHFALPGFIVTLAGMLAWQGFQLLVLGQQGTVSVPSGLLVDLGGAYVPRLPSWLLAIAWASGAVFKLVRRLRSSGEDSHGPKLSDALMGIFAAAVVVAACAVMNSDRGVPVSLLIFVVLAAFMHWVTTTRRFGRYVYAVGGNDESARRAGIAVNRIKVTVFALAGIFAAVGGIMAASRLLAVSQNSGGSDLLLYAIAGPVIAGTSLFGGRGSVWSAVLGALVVGSISNGMDLVGLPTAIKIIVTGVVLFVAVAADSVVRRTAANH